MSNITVAFIIVIFLNAFMMFSQAIVTEINPAANFYSGEGGIIEQHNIDTADPRDDLPGKGSAVETEEGNIFTDAIGSFLSWVSKGTGLDTVLRIVKAPYYYLKVMGLPEDFVNILGSIWYLVTLILIVLVALGRHN